MANCTCGAWKEGSKQIDNAIHCSTIHGWGAYTARPFVFCPWCGTELDNDERKENSDG